MLLRFSRPLFLVLSAVLLSGASPTPTPIPNSVSRPPSVTINPKTAPPAPSWGFRLVKGKQAGTLVLSFFSRDQRLRFDSTGPFVIQLNMPPAIQVYPSVITGTEWPKAPAPLILKIAGAEPGKSYPIAGAAGFTLCGPSAKSCRRVKTEIRYVVVGGGG